MKNKVFLRAYLNDNFGDDLFVQIIASRYPDTEFVLQMTERYGKRFPQNTTAGLSMYNRMALKAFQILDARLGTVFRKNLFCKIGCTMAREADATVYLIGSGFIERQFSEKVERQREQAYYENKPYLIGCNFGPYQHERYLELYRELFSQAEDICFRDTYSAELFSDLPQVRRAADVVFGYDLGYEKILSDQFGPYVLIAVVSLKKCKDTLADYEERYISYLENCMRLCREQQKKVVLVGFCKKEHDDEVIEKLLAGPEGEGVTAFYYPDCSYKKIMGLFAGADMVIAVRYHAMIVGFLFQKPVYVLAYSSKTVDALRDIEPACRCLRIEDIQSVSPEEFLRDYRCELEEERLQQLKRSGTKQFLLLDQRLNSMKRI
jgi:colanic acid/amylovoran biosynthesis protein